MYTGIGCDNFLICDKYMDNNKHTEHAKSIYKLSKLEYYSSRGFAFKDAHSMLHERETCMTSGFPYTLCKRCHSKVLHSNHCKFRQKTMKQFLAG